jgi:tetratricopeptide (TPR) repeat protein
LRLLAYHARAAVRSGDTGAAEALFRRAVTLNPVDGRAWLGLARLAATARPPRPAEARKTFRAGVAASRRNPHLLQGWGVFEERSGNLARAKGLFEAATHADPSHCASWVALGLWEQRHARDLYAARECFQKGANADPQNYYVWHVWGMLEQSMRNVAVARECFQTGVKANPQNAPTYVAWGVLEARLRNYTIAEQLFLHAQRANPRNAHALVAHAVLATRGGRQAKARALLDMALAVKPRDPAVYQTYGLLEAQAGRLDAARRRFQQGADVNPKHGPIWLAWGIMEQTAGDLARARQLFQQGVWSNPTSPHIVRIWHAWARLERSDGKLDSARKLFGHGLGADPTSVAILSNWAVLEAENHNMPFARDMLEKAVQLQPEHNDLWKLYVSLERDHGTDARAHTVAQRAALCEHQKERRLVVSEPLPGDFTAAGMWIDPADVDLTAAADSGMIIADPMPAPARDDARTSPVVPPAAPGNKKKNQNTTTTTTTTLHDKIPRRARDVGRRILPHLSPKPVLRRTLSPRGGADVGTEAGYLNYMMAFSFMDGGLA